MVSFVVVLLTCLLSSHLKATGTPDLYAPGQDPVMLLIGDDNFGDFASYNAPETNRLKIRIGAVGETIYFGLAQSYDYDGTPRIFGAYYYRIKRVSDGEIVHGPVLVNTASENMTTYEEAAAGPGELYPGGYATSDDFKYTADQAGDYVIEFSSQVRYLGLWDITVGSNGVELPGRVYSQNWAFRVPVLSPELPDCVWGAELNNQFYSYTSDGFVTQIDFENSGFQPLSFNLAFNKTGPGNSGDQQVDRMSVPNVNLTGNSAEHLVFIEQPDALEFPDGVCGSVTVADHLQCSDNGFCIPVSLTASGQVEIILDFNNNQVYDEGLDRLLVQSFEQPTELEHCVFWDGLLGDGSAPLEGTTVNLLVKYTQGVQHWALFDGELMRDGFCVTPVRPVCGDGGNAQLYYDDRNIPDMSGTNSPHDGRQGCDCATPDCRTWTNFDAATNDCDDINDGNTTGYGDKNTLNTWWFAAFQSQASLNVPVLLASISGPLDFCPGEAVVLSLNYFSGQDVASISWSGPDGFSASGGEELTSVSVTTAGIYQVNVVDARGCSTSATYVLPGVDCTVMTEVISVACNDNGTDTDASDDYFVASVRITGDNSAGWAFDDGSLSGNYGEVIELGPYPISGGNVNIPFTDLEYACCTGEIVLEVPVPCSDGCAISQTLIADNVCNDNGTPTDPTDDTFTFTVTLAGHNLGDGWESSEGHSGPYGVPFTFGPYPVAGGNRVIDFQDAGDALCTVSVVVTPPNSCSNECLFTVEVSNLTCIDNNTPFDPLDDQYTFDLLVTSINGTNSAYAFNDGGIGLYGMTQQVGPFLIADGLLDLTINDVVDTSCQQVLQITPPATCSEQCGIKILQATPNCDDNGTPDDSSDDFFFYDILVSSLSASNTSWVASDGTTGAYDELTQSVPYQDVSSAITITVTDAAHPFCVDTAVIEVPFPELRCPEDIEVLNYADAGINVFEGNITFGRNYFYEYDDLSCWLEQASLAPGGRYYDRFTFRNDSPLETGSKLYTFYLFEGSTDSSAIGALFRMGEPEEIDCCNLVNPGPIRPWDDVLEAPYLADSLYPQDLVLSQQFSALIYPQEDYTMVTTTWSSDTLGAYTWVVIAADGSELFTSSSNIVDSYTTGTDVMFNLYTFHLEDILNTSGEMQSLERPTIVGGCGTAEVAFRDTLLGESCAPMTLQRNYDFVLGDTTFFDVCSQSIVMGHLGLEDIILPPQNFMFTCTDSFPMLENGNPDPFYTGRPAVYDLGQTIQLDQSGYEGLIATYSDRDSLRPDGGLNIYRDWLMVDQCNMESMTYTQLFKLETGGTPLLGCPLTNHYCPILGEDIMVFTTGQFSCLANITVPLPDLINICDPEMWLVNTLIYRVDTLADGTSDTVELIFFGPDDERNWNDVVLGDYFIEYTGIHPNEDTISQTCRFRVADLHEPVPICRGNVNISLPGNGIYRVLTSHVDQGSYDNCDNFTLDIRRSYLNDPESCTPLDSLSWSEWGDFVDFTCCDVGDQLLIQLRITDAGGNVNFCESTVNVSDYTLPYCTGLETQNISCDELPDGFSPGDTLSLRSVFGMPEVVDNCSAFALELPPHVLGSTCAPEQIIRRFLAVDQHGNQANGIFTQTINVTPSLNYAIHFPRDTETDCLDNADSLRIELSGCDSFSVDFVEATLPIISNECRRFARTYTVTNWCEWDGVSPAIEVSRDPACTGVEGLNDVWVLRRNDSTFIDADSLEYNNFPPAGSSNCVPTNPAGHWQQVTSTGRWTYTQYISVIDETAPELAQVFEDSLCTTNNDCFVGFQMEIDVFDACQLEEGGISVAVDLDNDDSVDTTFTLADAEVTGSFPAYAFNYDLPIGRHEIVLNVTDDCGNTATTSRTVEVFDCYVPELQCLDYRLYNLQPLEEPTDIDNDGELEEAAVFIDANELGNCVFADCSASLIYTINRPGETPGTEQTGLYLDCNDRYQVDLELYVWDGADNPFSPQPDGSVGGANWRRCNVTVLLQDPSQACASCADDTDLTIAGTALSQQQSYLSGVVLSVVETGQTTGTNGNGRFQLIVEGGADYTVQATKNDDTPVGLSTLDLLLLQAHVLQSRIITDPYQLIAADVNADGSIDILDLIQLQRVIIGADQIFPDNTSWVFVPESWNGTGNPPVGLTFGQLQSCAFDAHLLGIKIGDLNGSAYPQTSSLAENAQGRSQTVQIDLTDHRLEAGKTYEVAMSLPAAGQWDGGQLSLAWNKDALQLLETSSEQLTDANFNRDGLRQALLSFNYTATLKSEVIVTIRFTALASGQLSEWLRLDERGWFRSEVYQTGSLAVSRLALNWLPASDQTVAVLNTTPSDKENAEIRLLGVFPNPARAISRISLELPFADDGVLTVTDLNGRTVEQRKISLEKGRQQLMLEVVDWPTGVYTYAIQLSDRRLNGLLLKN